MIKSIQNFILEKVMPECWKKVPKWSPEGEPKIMTKISRVENDMPENEVQKFDVANKIEQIDRRNDQRLWRRKRWIFGRSGGKGGKTRVHSELTSYL